MTTEYSTTASDAALTPRKTFPVGSVWLPQLARNLSKTGDYQVKVTRTSFSGGVMTVYYVYNFLTGPAEGTTGAEYSLKGGEFIQRFRRYEKGV